MKIIAPLLPDTKVGADTHEWIPASFDNFLIELENVISTCSGDNPLPIFRGQEESKWLLDSTFARTCKKILFDLPPHIKINDYIRQSREFHMTLLNLFLFKFGVLVRPVEELQILENEKGVDAWFELMKQYQ